MNTLSLLVVDDEATQREALTQILQDQGYRVASASNVQDAVKCISGQSGFDVILSDLRMPDGSGLDVVKAGAQFLPESACIVMTAFAEVSGVIEAFHAGVVDYILKPINVESLLKKLEFLQDRKDLKNEVKSLRAEISKQHDVTSRLLGESPIMKELRSLIEQVSATKGTVLITGESGTGKEVAARSIHQLSPQKNKKFIAINCGAIPEQLFESELFGHKRGSFTGAVSDKEGLFVTASGGTLFLDEIGEMPKSVQVKLLRALQEREVAPVGATSPIKVDVRLIAATNKNLQEDVESGIFRKDLYYRINVVELKMPPLRERSEDIPLLSQNFLKKYSTEFKKPVSGFTNDALKRLRDYNWPGNVRELENIIERAIILHKSGNLIQTEDLPPNLTGAPSAEEYPADLDEAVKQFTQAHIQKILRNADGDKKAAAQILGLGLSSLYRKLEEMDK